ncbi:hypothetical protein M2440_000205 [Methylorubrum extorquens]|nr:hypothetical protein [Methylorubrum extorquens]
MLLPLVLLLLGLWEVQRGADDHAAFEAEQQRLAGLVTQMEARAPRDGRFDPRLQFRYEGRTYGRAARPGQGARGP